MPPKPRPISFISMADIDSQIKKFRYEKWGPLSSIISKNESKCIWFSKNQIKELWEELQYQEIKNDQVLTGARVYLACFPDTHPKYSKQLNLIFVYTALGPNGNNVDFFIEQQPDFPSRPIPPVGGADLNHGTPCPPDCDNGENWP